jgi:hypothetical protein
MCQFIPSLSEGGFLAKGLNIHRNIVLLKVLYERRQNYYRIVKENKREAERVGEERRSITVKRNLYDLMEKFI